MSNGGDIKVNVSNITQDICCPDCLPAKENPIISRLGSFEVWCSDGHKFALMDERIRRGKPITKAAPTMAPIIPGAPIALALAQPVVAALQERFGANTVSNLQSICTTMADPDSFIMDGDTVRGIAQSTGTELRQARDISGFLFAKQKEATEAQRQIEAARPAVASVAGAANGNMPLAVRLAPDAMAALAEKAAEYGTTASALATETLATAITNGWI